MYKEIHSFNTNSTSFTQMSAIDTSVSPSKIAPSSQEPSQSERTSSRPVSPGVEVTEETNLEEKMKNKEAMKLENSRRKSMSWKGKLTRQLSSAQIKIISTFKEPTKMATKVPVMQSEPGTPIEHRDLTFATSELEVPSDMRGALSEGATAVPSDCSNSSSRTLSPNIDAEYLSKLEHEIVTSLEQAGYRDEATIEDETKTMTEPDDVPIDSSSDADSSDSSPEPTHQRTTQKKRTSSNPSIKRVEFSEEVRQRISEVDGARASRPSRLDLESTTDPDTEGPMRPPRHNSKTKLLDKRNERLLSVPNLKMSRQNLKDLRSKSGRSDSSAGGQGSSKFAGNLIRRFSKYHLYSDYKFFYSKLL